MITEILVLNSQNEYELWERMDRRKCCTWDCASKGIGAYMTEKELIKDLKKEGCQILAKVEREKLRVETAPEED